MTLQGVSSWMQVVRFQHKQLYSRGLSKYFRRAVARLSAGGEIWALMSVVAVVNLFLHFVLERTVNILIQVRIIHHSACSVGSVLTSYMTESHPSVPPRTIQEHDEARSCLL
jgi:hypothetical protein